MYADWLHDLQVVGGNQVMAAMFRGAEGYLETWERAWGVPATTCQGPNATLTAAGLGRVLRLGESSIAALYSAGQPIARPGVSYRYCVSGAANGDAPLSAVFDSQQRLVLIGTTAPGYSIGGIRPGERFLTLFGAVHRVAPGVLASRPLARGARYVWGVAGSRVRYVALVAPRVPLIAALRAAGL
jgi:hypothetical protein